MAYYAYKQVRDLLPQHIIDAQGPDYEGNGNYDGDQWDAAATYIEELVEQRDTARAELAKRDAEIERLQAKVAQLEAASVAWCELEKKL